MKTLAFILLALPLAARPTLEEALLADPVGGLLQEVLPTPSDLLIVEESGFDYNASNYGDSIALHGDFAFVSAPVDRSYGYLGPGAVYVFERSPTGWAQVQKLLPPDARDRLRFGESLDIREDGAVLVVGSNDRDTLAAANNASGAYVFRFNPLNRRFAFEQKLIPAGAILRDRAGAGVAVSGDWIGIGSPGKDGSFSDDVGDVTLFEWDPAGSLWVERGSPASVFSFTSVGDPGTFALKDDLFAYFNDFSDGAVTQIYRREAATGYWDQEDATGSSTSFAQPIMSFGPVGILTHGSDGPFLHRRPAAPGGSWTTIDTTTLTGSRSLLSAAMNSSLVVANFGGGATPNPDPLLEFHRIGENATSPLGTANTIDHGRATAIEMDEHTVLIAEYRISAGGNDIQVSAFTANVASLIAKARSQLFYQNATSNPAEAAFAYQTLLYDGNGPAFLKSTPAAGFESLYGEINRQNADEAEQLLKRLYPDAGGGVALEIEGLLLDIAHGRAAAELIRSREILRRLNEQRLDGTPLTPGNFFFINDEITLVRGAFQRSADALNPYIALLSDSLSVPMENGDPSGRMLFARQVPDRPLMPALDVNGDPVNGSTAPLLDGYKDLVFLYEALLQHTKNASELAALLIARAGGTEHLDEAEARSIIGDTKRLVFEQRILLDSLFPQLDEATRGTLGLNALADDLDTAVTELTTFEANLNGTINLLGYEPDFLMLVQTTGGNFDSFDTFKALLQSPSSRLQRAIDARQTALASLANFGETLDSLDTEWTRLADLSNGAIVPRLFDIVGVNPGEPGYDTPQNNVGSEIEQQYRSIEIARLRIERNGIEISNLREKVAIERRRRATESSVNFEISDLIIDFGNRQASLTEEIGNIEAAQAYSNAAKDLFSIEKLNPVNIIAGSVNAGVQLGAELAKGQLNANKERLAAQQDSQIRTKEDEILGANSRALIATWLLEMKTLSIDSQEAVILLRQEAGRLASLYSEQADLERRLEAATTRLASRYFADPIHRLRATNDTLVARIRFEEARKWLFFAARALEYKWNTPVDFADPLAPGGRWDIADLYRMRNAEELNEFFLALSAWDESDRNLNRTFIDYEDWFSLREDYFGYELLDDLTGEIRSYEVVDSETGEIVTVDAIGAFRNELRRSLESFGTNPALRMVLRFDTVRRNNYETNIGQFSGTLFNPDNYLDRIDDLQVFIRGPHQFLELSGGQPVDSQNVVGIEIGYAGTSFIRNENAGVRFGPERPDRVVGELTSYPTRFYRSDGSRFVAEEGLIFRTAEALKIQRGRSRGNIDFSEPNRVQAFRERSVATTAWLIVLTLNPGINPGSRLMLDEIDDIELHINHSAVQR